MTEFYVEDGYFQAGSQSSYAFALYSNVVTGEKWDKVYQGFLKKIEEDKGGLRSGIFGMPWTYHILSEAGRNDLIFSWLTREENPSFLNMLTNGNQILSEWFDTSMGSHNHAMFSSYTTWLIEKVLGVQVQANITSASTIKFSPYFPKKMDYAKGTIETVRGSVITHWERKNNKVKIILKIPKGLNYDLQLNKIYRLQHKVLQDEGFYRTLELIISERVDVPKT
jgi:alpha-L-rhamnosidase